MERIRSLQLSKLAREVYLGKIPNCCRLIKVENNIEMFRRHQIFNARLDFIQFQETQTGQTEPSMQTESLASLSKVEDNEQAGPSGLLMQGSKHEQKLRYENPKKEWIKRFRLTHAFGKPFVCWNCNESFSNPRDLVAHVKSDIGKMPIKCSKCGKGFTISSYAKERMTPSEKPNNCPECGERYPYSEYIKNFIADQTEKPYKCSMCKKTFLEKQPLEEHMQIHRDRIIFLLNWLQ